MDEQRRQIDRLLTIEEVADVLGLSPKTIRDWLRTGRLPGAKLGNVWRIRPEALQEFIAKAEREGGREG